MKTFRFIGMVLCAVLMCVNFTACSGSDDSPTEEKGEYGIIVGGKKITKIVSESENTKETRAFSYDDNGRLIKSKETYERDNKKLGGNSYQFIWGDNVIKCIGDNSYTLTIENGLIQSSDEGYLYSYNKSNRLVRVESKHDTTTAIWDGDKLVLISYDGHDNTLTYKESCKKGYFPFATSMIEDNYDAIFVAHPELVGTRSAQLPASRTSVGENETVIFSYEFNKEGYITKITAKSAGGSTETYTLTWE